MGIIFCNPSIRPAVMSQRMFLLVWFGMSAQRVRRRLSEGGGGIYLDARREKRFLCIVVVRKEPRICRCFYTHRIEDSYAFERTHEYANTHMSDDGAILFRIAGCGI